MDVTGIAWRTSSYSGDNGGACVEVGITGLAIAVRDSKHPNGPELAFTADTWKAFTAQLKVAALPATSCWRNWLASGRLASARSGYRTSRSCCCGYSANSRPPAAARPATGSQKSPSAS